MVGSSCGVAGRWPAFLSFSTTQRRRPTLLGPCQSCPASDNQTGNKPAAIAGILRLKTMARRGPSSGSALADSPVEGDGFELPVPRAMQARLEAKIAGFGFMSPSIICGCRRWPSAKAQSGTSEPNPYRARNRKFESNSRLRQKSKDSAIFGQPPYPVLYPGLSPIFVSHFWRVDRVGAREGHSPGESPSNEINHSASR
jgi:hypothetical protein